MVWIPPSSGPDHDAFMARFAGWRGVLWAFVVVSALVLALVVLGAYRPDPLLKTALGLAMGAAVLLFPVNFFLPLKRANIIGSALIAGLTLSAWVLVGVAVALSP